MSKGVKSPLFLCGMMGSGKSTVGRRLATRLSTPFYDLDREITESEGSSIPEIFSSRGEPYFRELERELLLKRSEISDGVLALGGGALQDQTIIDRLKNRGVLIFLDAPLSVLLERLKNDSGRPMLSKNSEPTRRSLTRLLAERRPSYSQAQLTIKIDRQSPEAIATEIIKKLKSHEG